MICESHFMKHYSRDSEGHFIVRIPLKLARTELGDSRETAVKKLERKLEKDKDLKALYCDFMKEYIDLDHMQLSCNETDLCNPTYYLPHHGVLRPDSASTKLRVVFDGSAVTTKRLSLNDIQFKGPSCQNDITDILRRFIKHKYAVCVDITKMYRQILVHERDRSLRKIVWRFSPNNPLLTYMLNTVTYGTASAPYLAIRCLKQLAEDVQNIDPLASNIIKHDFYVDDLITGFDEIDITIK